MVNRVCKPEVFNKHDPFGKMVAKDFLEYFGYEITEYDKEHPYDIDFLIEKPGEEEVFVEIEHADRWNDPNGLTGYTGSKFPYNTAHVPERKRKYFEKRKRSAFIGVDHKGEYLFIVGRLDILNSKVVRKIVDGNPEDFFDVPVKKIQIWKTNKVYN